MTVAAVIGAGEEAALAVAQLGAAGVAVAVVVAPPRADPALPDWASPTRPDAARAAADAAGVPWVDAYRWEPHLLPADVDVVVVVGEPLRDAEATARRARLGGVHVTGGWPGGAP